MRARFDLGIVANFVRGLAVLASSKVVVVYARVLEFVRAYLLPPWNFWVEDANLGASAKPAQSP